MEAELKEMTDSIVKEIKNKIATKRIISKMKTAKELKEDEKSEKVTQSEVDTFTDTSKDAGDGVRVYDSTFFKARKKQERDAQLSDVDKFVIAARG